MHDCRPQLVLVSEADGVREGWRLPTLDELMSIVDDTRACPTIDPDAFPGTPKATFWTATPCEDDPGNAWVVDFTLGEADTESQDIGLFVRLVRKTGVMGSWPQGTVYDSRTSLLWQRFVVGAAQGMSWTDAVRLFGGARVSRTNFRRHRA